MNTKYHVVITFPTEVFDVFHKENLEEDKLIERFQERLSEYLTDLCEKINWQKEYGETGSNLHWDIVLETKRKIKSGNLKCAIISALGISRSVQNTFPEPVKKHFVNVKCINFMPGIIAYNMKEGAGNILRKGYTETWLQEQARDGIRQHEKRKAGKKVYVNDSNFHRVVNTYMIDNKLESRDLRYITGQMVLENYSFCRVRNWRCLIAEFNTVKHKDVNEWYEFYDKMAQ